MSRSCVCEARSVPDRDDRTLGAGGGEGEKRGYRWVNQGFKDHISISIFCSVDLMYVSQSHHPITTPPTSLVKRVPWHHYNGFYFINYCLQLMIISYCSSRSQKFRVDKFYNSQKSFPWKKNWG